jgi:hypothetical protein
VVDAGLVWPTSAEYIAAVQDPANRFDGGILRFDSSGGVPDTAAGRSATVFFASSPAMRVVVRCYNRAPGTCEPRYQALAQRLAAGRMAGLADARWQAAGVKVRDQWWPVVLMEQVDGVSLGTYVEEHLADSAALLRLAGRWLGLLRGLAAAEVGHGDLQSDNVLVTPDEALTLVDFDSLWLPEVAHLPPDEAGHRDFQHPTLAGRPGWGRHVDTFAALTVYVSLRALAAEPRLWDDFHESDNLILTADDLARPAGSAVWHRLGVSPDVEVRPLVHRLAWLCAVQEPVEAHVHEVLRWPPPGTTFAGPVPHPPASSEKPWWEDAGGAAGTGSGGPAGAAGPGGADWWGAARPGAVLVPAPRGFPAPAAWVPAPAGGPGTIGGAGPTGGALLPYEQRSTEVERHWGAERGATGAELVAAGTPPDPSGQPVSAGEADAPPTSPGPVFIGLSLVPLLVAAVLFAVLLLR